MPSSSVRIPTPCSESWAAMTPTGAGRHCAACQTEVIDFTRLTEAEILAYLAARKGQRVCGLMAAPTVVPRSYPRLKGPWRWVLAVVAFLGGQHASALALPPQPLPRGASLFKLTASRKGVIIRGRVLDDSLNVPVAGIYVFISGTKYGAITDEQGDFTLAIPAKWELAKRSKLALDFKRMPFVFEKKTVVVTIAGSPTPAPLTVRLLSVPNRGYIMGKPVMTPPPVPLPGSGKS